MQYYGNIFIFIFVSTLLVAVELNELIELDEVIYEQ